MSTANLIPTEPLSFSTTAGSTITGATTNASGSTLPAKPAVTNPLFAALSTQLTENGAITHTTSGNACLDVFTGLMEGVDEGRVNELLDAAWKESPLDCLKLIYYTLDVREGKGCNQVFYACAQYLVKHHPETFLANLDKIAQFGYWKDLLEVLVWCLCGAHDRALITSHNARNKALFARSRAKNGAKRTHRNQGQPAVKEHVHAMKATKGAIRDRRVLKLVDDEVYEKLYDAIIDLFANQLEHDLKTLLDPTADKTNPMDIEKEVKKKDADVDMEDDEWLKVDKEDEGEKDKMDVVEDAANPKSAEGNEKTKGKGKDKKPKSISISLAAKWVPGEGKSHDKILGFYEKLAVKLAGVEPMEEGVKMKAEVVDWAKGVLRKKYLTPLRKHLAIVEASMSAKEWAAINYSKVPALSMKRNAPVFAVRDAERYKAFMGEAAKGNVKVNTATLKPHEIVSKLLKVHYYYENDDSEVPLLKGIPQHEADLINAQWLNYVEALKKSGSLTSTLAVVDVSGSMSGTPMEVAIALGLLTSEVTEEPWNNGVISFSSDPKFHEIKGNTLYEKVQFVQHLPWEMTTAYDKVFDMLLARAKAHNVPQDKMVERIITLSDMQFDQAAQGSYNTNFENIKAKFQAAGYSMPAMVFWNLRSSSGSHGAQPMPVTADENGTCLISGYSGNLMKLLLEGKELKVEEKKERLQENGMDVMRRAIGHERFECLVVVD